MVRVVIDNAGLTVAAGAGARAFPAARRGLWAALLVGLLLRLGVVLLAPLPPHADLVTHDDNRYDALAWNIAQGHGYTSYLGVAEIKDPPLLPLLSAGGYALFGHTRLPLLLLQALLSTTTIALVYGLARRLWGPGPSAGLAAGLAALYPDLILYANVLLTETLFIFCLCAFALCWGWALQTPARVASGEWSVVSSQWSVASNTYHALRITHYALRITHHAPVRWALVGGLLGLATLARPTVELLIGPVALVSWWAWPPGWRCRVRAGCLLAATGAFLAVLAPWTVRNYLAFQAVVPVATGAGIALWVGTNVAWGGTDMRGAQSIYGDPDFIRAVAGDPVTAERRLLGESVQHVLHDPAGVLALLPGKLRDLGKGPSAFGLYYAPGDPHALPLRLGMLAIYGAILILTAVGGALAWRTARPRLLILAVPPAYLLALTLLTIPAPRYMLPAIPFCMVLAALPLGRLGAALAAKTRREVAA